MTDDPGWALRVAGTASRKIAEVLPEAVATAVVELITGALLDDPHRVGKPLRHELAGRHVARRGSFRIIYRIDEDARTVEILDVAHRADVYRA